MMGCWCDQGRPISSHFSARCHPAKNREHVWNRPQGGVGGQIQPYVFSLLHSSHGGKCVHYLMYHPVYKEMYTHILPVNYYYFKTTD